MPKLNTKEARDNVLLKELIYGPSQTKKTFWAGMAAEAGYNVILLSGDSKYQVLFNLTEEAQSRITILPVADKITGPQFGYAVVTALKAIAPLIWNDTKGQQLFKDLDDEDNYILLDAKLLDHNFVLVVDSWTALVDSILWDFANEQGVDLSDGAKEEWELYGPCNRLATWILQQLQGLPCHVIVIGHSTMWEKRKGGKDKATKNEIIETRQQIISTSGNHSKLLPGHFSETLLFGITGNNYNWVDSRPQGDRDSGSRTLCKVGSWDEMQFKHFAEASGCIKPDPAQAESCGGLQFFTGADMPSEYRPKKKANLNLNSSKMAQKLATVPQNKSSKGMGGIFQKKTDEAKPKTTFSLTKKIA